MRYLDEYRSGHAASALLGELRRTARRPWSLMEVCGGQTHAIVRHGIDELLPPGIELLHGPGCPVCVTPVETIDRAHAIAALPDVTMATFGDMLRVPGSIPPGATRPMDLLELVSKGADVRIVYSPLDALSLAERTPERRVVFFGVGFETTAPATALTMFRARARGVSNFSLLASHVLVPPAIAAILQTAENRVSAFLGPGHVATITGLGEYRALASRYHRPIVITGFEPVDLLSGILLAVQQLEQGRAEVENPYSRLVPECGNPRARAIVEEVFEIADRKWRGVGAIPKSGHRVRHEYRAWDAERVFEVDTIAPREPPECISGQVLRGLVKPTDCPAFGSRCTPQSPLGATMVSAEGACAAYFASGRHRTGGQP